jgi:transposase
MTHAKEPWVIADDGTIESRDSGLVGNLSHATEESRRRIVACVNACKGIPNEQLECDQSEFIRIFNEHLAFRRQRDELLHALDDIVENGLSTSRIKAAKEAVARVKGQQ